MIKLHKTFMTVTLCNVIGLHCRRFPEVDGTAVLRATARKPVKGNLWRQVDNVLGMILLEHCLCFDVST